MCDTRLNSVLAYSCLAIKYLSVTYETNNSAFYLDNIF